MFLLLPGIVYITSWHQGSYLDLYSFGFAMKEAYGMAWHIRRYAHKMENTDNEDVGEE